MNVAGLVAIGDYYRFICEVMKDDLIANPVQIVEAGVIVEIDETKLGKCKYNRGHRVKGARVFGGVEQTVVVKKLEPLVRKLVERSWLEWMIEVHLL